MGKIYLILVSLSGGLQICACCLATLLPVEGVLSLFGHCEVHLWLSFAKFEFIWGPLFFHFGFWDEVESFLSLADGHLASLRFDQIWRQQWLAIFRGTFCPRFQICQVILLSATLDPQFHRAIFEASLEFLGQRGLFGETWWILTQQSLQLRAERQLESL